MPDVGLNGRDGKTLKELLKLNQYVIAVTRDRVSAYTKVVEEAFLSCMQITDCFHIHRNLIDIKKI